jgi:hypothetical protein
MDLPLDPALLLNHGAAKTWVTSTNVTCIPLILRSSWSAIFLYVYTGQVKFATIGSQARAIPRRLRMDTPWMNQPPHDQEGLGAPPPSYIVAEPCSPKSAYCVCEQGLPFTLLLRNGGTDGSFT